MADRAPASVGDISIREAVATDVPLLAELNQQLIRDERHRNSMSLGELQERMSGFLTGDYRAALFESGSDVLGYALFRPEAEHLYIRQLYVLPDYRRRGVGRSAVTWLKQEAWRDHSRIRLDVLTSNSAALQFWRSVGFSAYCLTLECERDDAQSRPTSAGPGPQQD